MELNPREKREKPAHKPMVGSSDQWRGTLSWPGSPAQAPGCVGASTASPCGDPGGEAESRQGGLPKGRNVGGVWSKGETDPRRFPSPAATTALRPLCSVMQKQAKQGNIPVNLSLGFFFFF